MANLNSAAQRSFAAEPYDSVAAVLASKQITAALVGQRIFTKDGHCFDVVASGGDETTAGGAHLDLVQAPAPPPPPPKPDAPAWATIQHKRTALCVYEVAVISAGTASLKKCFNTDVASNGVQTRITLKQAREKFGFPATFNCGGFRAPDGGAWNTSPQARPVGMQIVDGIAYQDFGDFPETSAPLIAAKEALVLMDDGIFSVARQSDGLSAQDWVDAGALWCAGFGPVVVEGGVLRDISDPATIDAVFRTTLSARTLLGQRANGDFVVIQVEGKSGEYGITGNDMGDLALSEGCVVAICLDGGGSTQGFWDAAYSHPTTDADERAICGFLAVTVGSVAPYDSGPIPVDAASGITPAEVGASVATLRQVGGNVALSLCAAGTFAQNSWVTVTEAIPARYRPAVIGEAKGVCAGNEGNILGVVMGSLSYVMSARCNSAAASSVSGTITWPSRWGL